MSTSRTQDPPAAGGRIPAGRSAIRLSAGGLIAYSATLMAVSSALTWFFISYGSAIIPKAAPVTPAIIDGMVDTPEPDVVPEWGELMKRDIEIARPDEYTAFNLSLKDATDWTLPAPDLAQARTLLETCGAPAETIDRALSPAMAEVKGGAVVVKPDEALLLALPAPARSKLYAELAKNPANSAYIATPFSFHTADFDAILASAKLDARTISLIKQLSYERGNRTCFSDLPLVLRRLPDDEARMNVTRVMSRISAVIVGVRIRPTTDVARVAAYWSAAPGVRTKDVRPLLESVQRQPNGGRVSLAYLLPPFARERLYTFPLTTNTGEADANCHWSTLNFFNSKPDDRFHDTDYAGRYIGEHYYQIARPGRYGDLVFIADEKGGVMHSAVFIADDIVFTKNGKGFSQPWLLMRLDDMAAMYSNGSPAQLMYYRNKDA